MNNLVIKNLKQQYTYGATAVWDLSLECGAETIAVLGSKESGKTSLLKCIAGLFPPLEGEIFINGELVNDKPPKQRDVLMVYEDGGFFKYRTVYYNLQYPLKIRKIPKEDIRKKIVEISKLLGFEFLLDYKINALSQAERLRVMIARTLMREAQVYLFDDPFKNVQPFYRRKLFQELYPHIKNLKGAKIFATSSPDEAKTVADKLIIMNYGFSVDEGTKESIKKSPSCLLSHKYMTGELFNPIKTKIHSHEENIYIDLFNEKLALQKDKLIDPIYIGKEVIACVEFKKAPKGFEVKKDFIEYVNNFMLLHGDINGQKIKMFVDNDKNKYNVLIDTSSIKLFDINSERSVYF